MQLESFKEKLQSLFDSDEEEMFKVLDRDLKGGPKRQEFLLLRKQFVTIKREAKQQLLLPQEAMYQKSRVWNALLEFIQLLETEDLKAENPFIVLILCKDEVDAARMRVWFSALPLQVVVALSNEAPDLSPFSLVVYDNHAFKPIHTEDALGKLPEEAQQHLRHMLDLLENGTKWVLHYGEYFYGLNDFREVSTAANNKYTLYARILEMRRYMEDYGVGEGT